MLTSIRANIFSFQPGIFFAGVLFLFAMMASDIPRNHPNSLHVDAGDFSFVGVSENKQDDLLPILALFVVLVSPEIAVRIYPSIKEDALHFTFTPISEFPSRASPAISRCFQAHAKTGRNFSLC